MGRGPVLSMLERQRLGARECAATKRPLEVELEDAINTQPKES
jgi:hypothetical protein